MNEQPSYRTVNQTLSGLFSTLTVMNKLILYTTCLFLNLLGFQALSASYPDHHSQSFQTLMSQAGDVDLKIVEIISPLSEDCQLPPYPVAIKITNLGTQPAYSFSAEIYIWNFLYNSDSLLYSVYEVSDTIFPGDTLLYVYPSPLPMILTNYPILHCEVFHQDDSNTGNNFQELAIDFYGGLELNEAVQIIYGYVNESPKYGNLTYAYDKRVYRFYIPEEYAKVKVSLCGSSFDTILQLFKCGGSNFALYSNDDFCGEQSSISMLNPEPGIYYARISGWNTSYGSYILNITSEYKQDIDLESGWSLFSIQMDVPDNSYASLMSPVSTKIQLMKDGDGNINWPWFNVFQIGTLELGQAYQIKMSQLATLSVYGDYIQPENHPISLVTGWNLIGYLKNAAAPIEGVLANLQSSLILAKNGLGQVYWPQNQVNTIQTMNPGEGYQLKMLQSDTLVYVNE